MPLLETEDLTVTFGGLRAVDAVSLHVDPGSLVGLIGPNGAGKTTFIDALTGFVPAVGDITFDGIDIGRLAPHRRARAGLARTWQAHELFDDLSVVENLDVAAERLSWTSTILDLVRPSGRSRDERVAPALDLLELSSVADRMPTELSEGQRKLVGVARALAADPKLILMDEPAAGLDAEESRRLGRRLRSLCDRDIAVLLIDHDMDLVLSVCDYIYVLEFGRVIAHGPREVIRTDPDVIKAYLGSAEAVDAIDEVTT